MEPPRQQENDERPESTGQPVMSTGMTKGISTRAGVVPKRVVNELDSAQFQVRHCRKRFPPIVFQLFRSLFDHHLSGSLSCGLSLTFTSSRIFVCNSWLGSQSQPQDSLVTNEDRLSYLQARIRTLIASQRVRAILCRAVQATIT